MDSKKAELPNITLNINLNDYWKTQMEANKEIKEVDKTEEVIVTESKIDAEGGDKMTKQEEEVLKAMDPKMKACMTGHMKEGKSMADAKAMCEKAVAEEQKVDGEEDVKKADEEAQAPVEEEAGAEEAQEEVAEEVVVEEAAAEAPAEEVAQADKTGDLLKQVLTRLDEIGVSLKKQDDSASAEGATSGDEPAAPEGGEGDSPVEEKASEDASPEGAEKVEKVDAEGINKIADQISKLNKSFEDKFTALETRLSKIEEQPAPSKVVSPKVVSKAEDRDEENPHQERLNAIKEELAKLEDLKNKDQGEYQKGRMWEKAFNLMAERDQLMRV